MKEDPGRKKETELDETEIRKRIGTQLAKLVPGYLVGNGTTAKPTSVSPEEAQRIVTLMVLIDALYVAAHRKTMKEEDCEAQAKVWSVWLRPHAIPLKDLPDSFILGDAIRDRNKGPFGCHDIRDGFAELRRRRQAAFERGLTVDGRRLIPAGNLQSDCPFCFGGKWERVEGTDKVKRCRCQATGY